MRILKNKKLWIKVVVGTLALVAMAWYINTYIYKFLAAFPKVAVEVKPYSLQVGSSVPVAITNIAPNKEFTVRVSIANQNIDAVDLFLTYDKTKVAYIKEYTTNYAPGSGYTQFPDQYFTSPIIEEVSTVGDKKQLRVALMSVTTERKNLINLNFKFKSLADAPLQSEAIFTLESKSEIVGVDATNNVVTFDKDPATAIGKISIQIVGITPSTGATITPTITPTGIIAAGSELIGHWKLDDNVTGTDKLITDSSGKNNHGKSGSINTVGVDCTVAGKYGKACSFDGADDYININPFVISSGTGGNIDPLWAKAKKSTVTNLYPWTDGGPTTGWESYIAQWVYICNKSTCWIIDGSKNPREFVNNGVPFEFNTHENYDTETIAAPDGTKIWTNGGPTAAWSYELANGTTDADRLVTNIPKETIINEAIICNGKWCWRYIRPPNAVDGYLRDGDDVDSLKGDPINLATRDFWKDHPELYTNNGPSVAWNDPVNKKSTLCNGSECWSLSYGPNGRGPWVWNGKVSPGVFTGTSVTSFNAAWTSPPTKTISLCNSGLCHLFNLLPPVGYQASATRISDGSGQVASLSDFTIEAWVKPNDMDQDRKIVSSLTSTGQTYFDLSLSKLPTFSFRGLTGDMHVSALEAPGPAPTTWYHITGVRKAGGTAKIYINGVEKRSFPDTTTGSIDVSKGIFIGWDSMKKSTAPGLSFKGSIDDVRLYNYARTAAQITDDMNNNPTVTITVTPPTTTVTSPPQTGGNTKINMKIKFQGVTNPKPNYDKVMVAVSVGSPEGALKKVEFTHQGSGIYSGTYANDLTASQRSGAVYIKGPKHIRKKVCTKNPTEAIPGTYKCTGTSGLVSGTNEMDLTGIILLAGDLPEQDGIVNSLDFAFIRQNFGRTDAEVLVRGDLNFDGIIHTDDHTLVKTALEFKYDEE